MQTSRFVMTLAALASILTAAPAFGTVLLDDSFTYTDGALVGQGGWGQTGTVVTNPIQVSSGQAVLGTSGQDAYKGLSASAPNTPGNSLYTGADVTVTAAQATGDYFLHLSDPLATSSNFYQRVFAKASGGGFVLGLVDNSGTGSVITYGTNILNLGQTYRVVVGWTFVAGTTNDTFKLYVDPADASEPSNTPYLTHTWTSTLAEPAQLAAANLRQGSASNAPSVKVDNLVVSTGFAEAVPEPATVGLLGLGMLLFRRRKTA